MDFKSRLNSCGRFSTDENFKKIIMRNSTRLRQNSVLNKKEVNNITDLNTELNNIKVINKNSNNNILSKNRRKRKQKERKEEKE